MWEVLNMGNSKRALLVAGTVDAKLLTLKSLWGIWEAVGFSSIGESSR